MRCSVAGRSGDGVRLCANVSWVRAHLTELLQSIQRRLLHLGERRHLSALCYLDVDVVHAVLLQSLVLPQTLLYWATVMVGLKRASSPGCPRSFEALPLTPIGTADIACACSLLELPPRSLRPLSPRLAARQALVQSTDTRRGLCTPHFLFLQTELAPVYLGTAPRGRD